MSDATKLDPRSLTNEERAIVEEMVTRDKMFLPQTEFANAFTMNLPEHWQQSYDCALARIEAMRRLFGEPASEPAKVECPNCGEPVAGGPYAHADGAFSYTCIARQAEPAAAPTSEMPEAVQSASRLLRSMSYPSSSMTADALESWWRSQQAEFVQLEDKIVSLAHEIAAMRSQPAKVRMTEELRDLLIFVDSTCSLRHDESWRPETLESMKKTANAVRAQAEQAQAVRLPQVRTLIEEVCSDRYDGKQYRHLLDAALAELDAAEGVTG